MRNNSFFKWSMAGVALVGLAYLLSAIMFTRQARVQGVREKATPAGAGVMSVITNFRHVESHLDQVGWELSAKKAELLEGQARLYSIRMRFYTPEKEVISVRGEVGTIDLGTNNVGIRGNVRAVYNGTYHFYSDEVSWDSKTNVLRSPGPVRIVSPDGEIRGATLVARPAKKRFVIRKGVEVQFRGNPKDFLPNQQPGDLS
jgi:LPS export ABC transporter protein LptC